MRSKYSRVLSAPTFQHVKRGPGFSIISLLAENGFLGCVHASEVSKLFLRDLYLRFSIRDAIVLAQLCA
jgi:hypothetical protein